MTHGSLIQDIFGDDGLQASYEALLSLMLESETFLVVSHEGPDGDAIGSTLGVCHLLRALGKKATPFNVDRIPCNFGFLHGADEFLTEVPDTGFDMTILVDCAEQARVGERFPAHGWGRQIAVIDHHKTWDPDFGDVYVRDISAGAVGEMVYRLALTAGIQIDEHLSQCCYVSIMTDTGGFRYGKTTGRTFKIAAELVGHGVSPWEMTSNIFENDPLPRIRLLGKVLNTLAVSDCGRLAFIVVEQEMMADPGLRPEMLDGFINYARRIRGVEVATQLRQVGPSRYKVSFRSRGRVDVAALAESFGGGGHRNAAGCLCLGDAEQIERDLARRLEELL